MTRTISSAEAARDFRKVLDEIASTGETFRIEQDGQTVAQLGPPEPFARRFTGKHLAEALSRLPAPDEAFAADLVELRAIRRDAPTRDPWQTWESSSTAQS